MEKTITENAYYILESSVRETFASVVWSHKIQEKQADICSTKFKIMDECWLDLTGCRLDPVATAEEIRATTKSELGLTVSIGVSFNKIFAKLGSDMKKPDAMKWQKCSGSRKRIRIG